MSRCVLFLILAAVLCASLVSAQTCTGGGYDLSGLTGATYSYVSPGGWAVSNYTYYLSPCGMVNAPAPVGNCSGASFCQFETDFNGSYPLQVYNSSISVQWIAVTGGVEQRIQDGAFCGAINAYRETTIFFQCNASATTPYFSGVQEFETCHYQATLQTSSACTATSTTGANGVGSSWISPVCGGGVFNGLSALSSDSLWYNTNSSSSTDGFIFYVNVCGVVTNTTGCPGQPNAMICQADKVGNTYTIAVMNVSVPTIWTLYSNGISMSIQDGTLCGGDGDREVLLYFVCDATATTPVLTSIGEGEVCHYTGYIQTAAACSSTTSGSSSSTAASAAGSSSSISAVSTSSSSLPASSSSAASPASSSSAVSSSAVTPSSSSATTPVSSSSAVSPSSSAASPSSSAVSPSSTSSAAVVTPSSSSSAVSPSSTTGVIVVPSSSSVVVPVVNASSSTGPSGPSASGAVSTSSLSASAFVLCAGALVASLVL